MFKSKILEFWSKSKKIVLLLTKYLVNLLLNDNSIFWLRSWILDKSLGLLGVPKLIIVLELIFKLVSTTKLFSNNKSPFKLILLVTIELLIDNAFWKVTSWLRLNTVSSRDKYPKLVISELSKLLFLVIIPLDPLILSNVPGAILRLL